MLVTFRGAPYVPSRPRDVRRAFSELYTVGESDVVVDIGSGDGVVLRLAAEHGGRAVGYELNPFLVLLSKWLARKTTTITTKWADVWMSRAPDDTTLIYVFGTGKDLPKIMFWTQEQANRIGRTIYLMSYGFELPNQRPMRTHGAHHLYEVQPLQPKSSDV